MKLSVLMTALVLLGTPVLAVADDLESSFQNLKDAEAKGDAAQVKKLAGETAILARQAIAEPAPQADDEKEAWTQRVAWAKYVESYTEYALYAVAVKSPAATTVDLLAALERQNPNSKYLDQGYGNYLYALSQSGGSARITAVAERGLQSFPENEDLLLVLADNSMSAKQPDKALGYANRLLAVLGRHPKPEGMADSDWERKRTTALGRGYWISGVINGERNQHAAADRSLRAALPAIRGNDAMTGPALFYLGVANYNLGLMTNNKAKVLEGAKFSDDCSKIVGPYQEQAWKNAQAMKTKAGTMR